MDTLKPHEKLFIFGLFAAQIAAVLLALPIFLITTRGTKFAITTVLVVAGLFFTICYFIYNRGMEAESNTNTVQLSVSFILSP